MEYLLKANIPEKVTEVNELVLFKPNPQTYSVYYRIALLVLPTHYWIIKAVTYLTINTQLIVPTLIQFDTGKTKSSYLRS